MTFDPLGQRYERLKAELQAAQERERALREALEEARPYVYGVTRDDQQWRAETASDVLGRVDAALTAQRTEEPSEDDEGLEPIETSPLAEREPDL